MANGFPTLKFALDTSILAALCKEIPQGKCCLDRPGAVLTAPGSENCHFEMSWFKMYGLRAPAKTSPLSACAAHVHASQPPISLRITIRGVP